MFDYLFYLFRVWLIILSLIFFQFEAYAAEQVNRIEEGPSRKDSLIKLTTSPLALSICVPLILSASQKVLNRRLRIAGELKLTLDALEEAHNKLNNLAEYLEIKNKEEAPLSLTQIFEKYAKRSNPTDEARIGVPRKEIYYEDGEFLHNLPSFFPKPPKQEDSEGTHLTQEDEINLISYGLKLAQFVESFPYKLRQDEKKKLTGISGIQHPGSKQINIFSRLTRGLSRSPITFGVFIYFISSLLPHLWLDYGIPMDNKYANEIKEIKENIFNQTSHPTHSVEELNADNQTRQRLSEESLNTLINIPHLQSILTSNNLGTLYYVDLQKIPEQELIDAIMTFRKEETFENLEKITTLIKKYSENSSFDTLNKIKTEKPSLYKEISSSFKGVIN